MSHITCHLYPLIFDLDAVAGLDLLDIDFVHHGDVGDDGTDSRDRLGVGIDHSEGGYARFFEPQNRIRPHGRAFTMGENENLAGNGLPAQGMLGIKNDAGVRIDAAQKADGRGANQGFAGDLAPANEASLQNEVHELEKWRS